MYALVCSQEAVGRGTARRASTKTLSVTLADTGICPSTIALVGVTTVVTQKQPAYMLNSPVNHQMG